MSRTLSIEALINCVQIGLGLKKKGFVPGDVIVEAVCGAACAKQERLEANLVINNRLTDSLAKVVKRVPDTSDLWTLSCELEPGKTYLLNDVSRISALLDSLDKKLGPSRRDDNNLAMKHIALNLDIAHMIISGINSDALTPYVDRIAHAHVADHPGQHYRDQFLGRCGRNYASDMALLDLYANACKTRKANGLPCSHHTSVELEGNALYGWIQRSCEWLRTTS